MTTIGLAEHADQHDIEPRAFDYREMAEALDRNRDWIRRHMRELPHHRFPGGRVMFCDGCVRAYLRQTFVPPILRRKR